MVGSSAELSDLKAAYVSCEGDMERVVAELSCCTVQDLERHCHTVQSLIDSRQLTHYKTFTRSAAELRKRAAAHRHRQQVILPLFDHTCLQR